MLEKMAWDDPLTTAVNDVLWCLVSSWYYLLVLIIPGNSQGRVCGDLLKLVHNEFIHTQVSLFSESHPG